jgi:hypothetical protein
MGQQPVVPTGDPLPESIQMIEGMSRVVGYPDGPLLWIIAGAGLLRHRARDAGTELTSRASASPLRYQSAVHRAKPYEVVSRVREKLIGQARDLVRSNFKL